MKRLMPLLFLVGLASIVSASTQNAGFRIIMNGYAIGSGMRQQVLTLHVHGQPVEVFEMILRLRIMNQNGGPQPADLEIVNYISFDVTGHCAQCQRWFQRVSADENYVVSRIRAGANVSSFPFLQLAIFGNSQRILTDEGTYVYPGNSVECWETKDFWP